MDGNGGNHVEDFVTCIKNALEPYLKCFDQVKRVSEVINALDDAANTLKDAKASLCKSNSIK